MTMERLEAVVSGRVHGTMYRNYLCATAQALNLTGEVKNLPQETLWIAAEGPPDVLEQYLYKIQHPPFILFAHVNDVSYSWHEPSGRYQGEFHLRFDE